MTDKERMIQIVEEQPEDSSYDEILRELAFSRMVEPAGVWSAAATAAGTGQLRRRSPAVFTSLTGPPSEEPLFHWLRRVLAD